MSPSPVSNHVSNPSSSAALAAFLRGVERRGAVLAELQSGDAGDGDVAAATCERPQLVLAEPRSGPTPRRRSSNATSTSLTDPDARLRGKPGQRPHLVHRAQIAVDPKARCIVACLGETADGHEGDALVSIIQRARFACPELGSVGADQGFAAERVWTGVAELGVTAFVPPQRTMLPADGDPKTAAQREAQTARERCKTAQGIWAYVRRMADAEGGVAELKNEHGLGRARCRGTSLFHVQLLLGATALNIKRLTSRADAADGQAAGPATAQADAEEAAADAIGAAQAAHTDSAGRPAARPPIVPTASAAWTITLSLN